MRESSQRVSAESRFHDGTSVKAQQAQGALRKRCQQRTTARMLRSSRHFKPHPTTISPRRHPVYRPGFTLPHADPTQPPPLRFDVLIDGEPHTLVDGKKTAIKIGGVEHSRA